MIIEDLMNISPIIPVVTIEDENDAIALAQALITGGINIMEITLRTNASLKAIKIISENIKDMHVGAGTVCNTNDFNKAIEHGAKFVFSPGINQELIDLSKKMNINFVPGVSTASEVMLAQNNGLKFCKLFPAVTIGGINLLKDFSGPFPKISFCPTGGITLSNMNDFLRLKNVSCVGGTWIVDKRIIAKKEFTKITMLCKEALENIK